MQLSNIKLLVGNKNKSHNLFSDTFAGNDISLLSTVKGTNKFAQNIC